MRYFILVLCATCFGQQVQRSVIQREYLADLERYPLAFQIASHSADQAMRNAEGFLVERYFEVFHSSTHGIKGQFKHIFVTISRVDLKSGNSRIVLQASPFRYYTAGRTIPVTDLSGMEALRDISIPEAQYRGYIAKREKPTTNRELLETESILKLVAKLMVTGEPYPSATLSEVFRETIEGIGYTLISGKPDQKHKAAHKYTSIGDLIVNSRLAKTKGADRVYLGGDKYFFY